MDRKLKLSGLVGGAAAMAAFGGTQLPAAPNPDEVLQARNFSELLQPIPRRVEASRRCGRLVLERLGGQDQKGGAGCRPIPSTTIPSPSPQLGRCLFRSALALASSSSPPSPPPL